MENNWIYIGIFLDEKSKEKIKKLYPIPEGWREYYDHMTVVFNDSTDIANAVKSINGCNIDKKFKLKIVGTGISDKAYAAHVELPKGVVCANKIAHITLGCSNSGNAVDSNYITNWSTLHESLYVSGKMQVVTSPTSVLIVATSVFGTKIEEANVY